MAKIKLLDRVSLMKDSKYIWKEHEDSAVPDIKETFGIVVSIGTTRVSCYLFDKKSGKQVSLGSRLQNSWSFKPDEVSKVSIEFPNISKETTCFEAWVEILKVYYSKNLTDTIQEENMKKCYEAGLHIGEIFTCKLTQNQQVE